MYACIYVCAYMKKTICIYTHINLQTERKRKREKKRGRGRGRCMCVRGWWDGRQIGGEGKREREVYRFTVDPYVDGF